MSRKTIGYRLFSLGRVPRRVRERLESEGIRMLDEGIRVDVTLSRYRAPGRAFAYRRQVLSGAIVLTSERVAAYVWWGTLFDVPLHDRRLSHLAFSLPRPGTLQVAFDAEAFDDRRSGRVRLRFQTDRADAMVERLNRVCADPRT